MPVGLGRGLGKDVLHVLKPPSIMELGDIRLRRTRPDDLAAIFEYGSDPSVARYADWAVVTSMTSLAERAAERAKLWDAGSEYYWNIATVPDDLAIGAVDLRLEGAEAELGYLLNKNYWNRGYATRAARAVLDWALANPQVSRVWATCDVENLASARVLEKIGMHREAVLRDYAIRPALSALPRDAFLYARTRTAC